MSGTGIMTIEWEFLEPWYTTIKNNLISERFDEDSALQVLFRIVKRHQTQDIFVKIPVDGDIRQNVARLQHLREALELFTILSVVNIRAFDKLFPSNLGNQQTPANVGTYNYPTWHLCLAGTQAYDDFAAIQSLVSWGTLLGFPSEPPTYSVEFCAALERLRGLGIEESSKMKMCDSHKVHWICRHWKTQLQVSQECSTSAAEVENVSRASADGLDFVDFVSVGIHKLFNAQVPPLFQYHATRSSTELIEMYQKDRLSLDTTSKSVVASIFDITKDFPKLTAALAVSNMASLSLSFHLLFQRMVDVPQITINAGFFFNTFLCSQPLVIECENMDTSSSFLPTRRLTNEELTLSFSSLPDCVFSATCSAVAEISSEAHLSSFDMSFENAGPQSWSWLIYALCCGTSSIDIPSVGIGRACLTKSDLLVIKEVLRTNYPLPVLDKSSASSSQYGFVDICKGANLTLSGDESIGNRIRVISGGCRCRALYNPANDIENVELIIPGYGACKARIGDNIQFTPDSGSTVLRKKHVTGTLTLDYVKVENSTLLMDLLAVATYNLRELSLREDEENENPLDLAVLCTVCPELQELSTNNFNVLVSFHNESLRRWSIKEVSICKTHSLSDLTSCLNDRNLRMSRELLTLDVTQPKGQGFDEEEVADFTVHDGEFLPVTNEKLPFLSKAAMISIVTSAGTSKAVYRLDTHMLSLIFVLAATPAQRSVRYKYRYW